MGFIKGLLTILALCMLIAVVGCGSTSPHYLKSNAQAPVASVPTVADTVYSSTKDSDLPKPVPEYTIAKQSSPTEQNSQNNPSGTSNSTHQSNSKGLTSHPSNSSPTTSQAPVPETHSVPAPNPAPTVPPVTIVQPLDSETVNPGELTIKWKGIEGAAQYEVQILGHDTPFPNQYGFTADNNTTSFAENWHNLLEGYRYSVTVTAYSYTEEIIATKTINIRIASPDTITITSPLAGSTIKTGTPVIVKWNASRAGKDSQGEIFVKTASGTYSFSNVSGSEIPQYILTQGHSFQVTVLQYTPSLGTAILSNSVNFTVSN